MVDSPSGRVPAKAPRWDLADTEGYGGGNCVSWCSWMFSGYVGIYWRKKYVGGRPPPSWAPRCSTDVLLPPIYTYVPPNYQIRSQNPNSTAVTSCIHEIPSWGLFRSSAGGASIMEGFYINTIASPMMCE